MLAILAMLAGQGAPRMYLSLSFNARYRCWIFELRVLILAHQIILLICLHNHTNRFLIARSRHAEGLSYLVCTGLGQQQERWLFQMAPLAQQGDPIHCHCWEASPMLLCHCRPGEMGRMVLPMSSQPWSAHWAFLPSQMKLGKSKDTSETKVKLWSSKSSWTLATKNLHGAPAHFCWQWQGHFPRPPTPHSALAQRDLKRRHHMLWSVLNCLLSTWLLLSQLWNLLIFLLNIFSKIWDWFPWYSNLLYLF